MSECVHLGRSFICIVISIYFPEGAAVGCGLLLPLLLLLLPFTD